MGAAARRYTDVAFSDSAIYSRLMRIYDEARA